jgi:hypothetical protein
VLAATTVGPRGNSRFSFTNVDFSDNSGAIIATLASKALIPKLINRNKPDATGDSREDASVIRFGFTIRTRSGQRVDNISIMAATRDDAERRLRQMYHMCEVITCRAQAVERHVAGLDLAAVIEMMSAHGPRTISPR